MSDNPQSILENISAANGVAVLLPKDPPFQAVAGGLAIYLALRNAGKNADIACKTPMIVDVNQLVGVDQVKTKLSGRNLVISFDYVKDAIEKVSYNVEMGKFNLVIQPKEGHKPLSANKVMYSYLGAGGDTIILVGTTAEEEATEIFGSKDNIDRQLFSLVAGENKGLISEAAALINQLGWKLDQDIANNLYQGLIRETGQFAKAKAADFETAAFLVKSGAVLENMEKKEANEGEKRWGGEDQYNQEVKLQGIKSESGKSGWLSKPRVFRSGKGD